jgi:hypothetical protein
MAKIGTAHVEIKPVLNEEALEQIVQRIEEAVRRGVEAGLASRPQMVFNGLTVTPTSTEGFQADAERRRGVIGAE